MKKKYDKKELTNGVSDDAKAMEVLEKFGYPLPNSLELENRVLGAILIDEAILGDVLQILKPEHFFSLKNKVIFTAMRDLFDNNDPVDINLIAETVYKNNLDSETGAFKNASIRDYLVDLTESTSTTFKWETYSKYILEKAFLRTVVNAGSELADAALQPDVNVWEVIGEAQSKLFKLTDALTKGDNLHALKTETAEIVEIFKTAERKAGIAGIPTGFSVIDEDMGGGEKGDFVIVAGRPSHGKTAYALNWARNAAVDHGYKIAIFSMEMKFRKIMARLLAMEALVNSNHILKGTASPYEWKKISETWKILETWIWIDDSSYMTTTEFKAKVRKLKKEQGIDMIIVDHIGKVKPDRIWTGRKDLEVGDVSLAMKELAGDLDIVSCGLVQLNRNIELRKGHDKYPQLADLRDSGNLEQDADIVKFVFSRFLTISPEEQKQPDNIPLEFERDIICAKNRDGGLFSHKLKFLPQYTKFENIKKKEVDLYHDEQGKRYPEPADVPVSAEEEDKLF